MSSIEIISRNSENLYLSQGSEITEMLRTLHRASSCEEGPKVKEILHQYSHYCSEEDPEAIDPRYVPLSHFTLGGEPNGYLSTIWFVQQLTEISSKILSVEDKLEVLKQELRDVNSLLPAAVYVPFMSQRARTCALLHIPISEIKVFTTKERAPFMLCLEIYNPYEELAALLPTEEEEPTEGHPCSQRVRSASVPSLAKSLLFHPVHENITNAEFEHILKEAATRSTFMLTEDQRPQSTRPQDSWSTLQVHYESINQTAVFNDYRGSMALVYDVETEEDKEAPVVFKETFLEQAARVRAKSPFRELKTWGLLRIIVKSGDDLRQEQFAMQLISLCAQIFREDGLSLWLYPYEILATGPNCGILECVPDAVSIDGMKKALPAQRKTLHDFFHLTFGSPRSRRHRNAQKNFKKSLAGYALVSFLLQIKDRHNGNILIDNQGRLIHIDFGFFLSNSPGGGLNFETAPFKLTEEFERVLGGRRSHTFQSFRALCVKGMIALKNQAEKIVLLVEMMRTGIGASLPCCVGGEEVSKGLRSRLIPREGMSEEDYKEYVNRLIDESLDNWHTQWYDRCQYCCQDILY